MATYIAPSILSADFGNLDRDIRSVEDNDIQYLHIDVMDGYFVPNISFGFPLIQAMRVATDMTLDVHLMIDQPERYIEQFSEAGADIISVHQEASIHLHRVLQQIKSLGKKAGVALNPATSIDTIADILSDVDLVVLMSVNPGFAGQKFIPAVLEKVKKLHAIKVKNNLDFKIEIDGGVHMGNIRTVAEAGADIVVAGSAVFNSEGSIAHNIQSLRADLSS